MNNHKLEKALYTLTILRLKYRYPNAAVRKKEIKHSVEYNSVDLVPTRFTEFMDHIIDTVYEDAYKIRAKYNAICSYIKVSSSKEAYIIRDKHLEDYKNILGEDITEIQIPHQQAMQPNSATPNNSEFIPF